MSENPEATREQLLKRELIRRISRPQLEAMVLEILDTGTFKLIGDPQPRERDADNGRWLRGTQREKKLAAGPPIVTEFWARCRQINPAAPPWEAAAEEFGVNIGQCQDAYRSGTLPPTVTIEEATDFAGRGPSRGPSHELDRAPPHQVEAAKTAKNGTGKTKLS